MKQLLLLFLIASFGRGFAQNETYYHQVFDSVTARNDQKNGIIFFEAELKKYPKNELILRSLGALNFQLLKFKETKFYYEKALLVNPECAKCYFYLAEVEANENNPNGAYITIEKGLSINSKEGVLYLLRGKLKLSQGDEIGALNDLSKAILVEPDGVAYYIERADYFIRKENYFSAKRDLLKAQELDPKNVLVCNYLAQFYSYDNDFPNALNVINKALEIDPKNIGSLLTRGGVYNMMKDYNHAIEDYKQVIALDPQNYHGYLYLSEATYKLEQIDESCNFLSKSIKLMEEQKTGDREFLDNAHKLQREVCDSSVSSYYYQRGIAEFNMGRPKEAIAFYATALEKFPNEYLIYSFMGNAELFLSDNQVAIASYKKALLHLDETTAGMLKSSNYSNESAQEAKNAFCSSTYLSLAFCYFNLENTDSALSCINLCIEYRPDMKDFKNGIPEFIKGILLMDEGNYKEAEKAFVRASEMSPDWSICSNYVALSLIAQAMPNAVSRNKLQIKTHADLEDLHWTLPYKIIKGHPEFDRAMEQIRKALRINPSDSFSVYLKAYLNRQMRMNYCDDFLKANQLGYPVELVYLKECR